MANPSDKSPELENAIAGMFGFNRAEVIQENMCVPAPFGCGLAVNMASFEDALSRKEYGISGLCQACQNSSFGAEEPE